jgi:hypothetical protein
LGQTRLAVMVPNVSGIHIANGIIKSPPPPIGA